MPTREAQFLKDIDPATVPPNLIIRMSSHMIDQGPVKQWPWTSTVTSQEAGPARPLNRATAAEAAGHAGTGPHQTCVTVNINMLYVQITQNIMLRSGSEEREAYKLSSFKRQASQPRAKGSSFKPEFNKLKDPMNQGTSAQAHGPGCKQQG